MPESLEELIELLRRFFQNMTNTAGPGIPILISLAAAAGSYLLARYVILGILLRRNDPTKRFNYIVEARIPHAFTLLVPSIVIFILLPYYLTDSSSTTIALFSRLNTIYFVIVITLILHRTILAINLYYNSLEYSRTFPITSILQVVRFVLFILSTVVIISVLFNIQSIYILTAIGALIAAATVVLNNFILAFLAGLILTSKKLIVIGDFIEIPELRINGNVQEITLTTVIVRNLDHTIGTVPSEYLLTHTFKNWRGVLDAGARQMHWPVYFDLDSVKPASQALKDEISYLPHGPETIRSMENFQNKDNSQKILPVQQSAGTNLGLFREYLILYLRNNPRMISQNLLSVYFEAPTKFGIPMQVIVSTNETDYARFLEIQSSLLEDILQLAVVFDLKVYQANEWLDPMINSEVEK